MEILTKGTVQDNKYCAASIHSYTSQLSVSVNKRKQELYSHAGKKKNLFKCFILTSLHSLSSVALLDPTSPTTSSLPWWVDQSYDQTPKWATLR